MRRNIALVSATITYTALKILQHLTGFLDSPSIWFSNYPIKYTGYKINIQSTMFYCFEHNGIFLSHR